MTEPKECATCGCAYVNAAKHQQFHAEIAAWGELTDVELRGGRPPGED